MTKWRLPRAAAATLNAYTQDEGEIFFDTTNDEVRFGDGATAGGVALARKDGTNLTIKPTGATSGRTAAAWASDVINVKADWGGGAAVGDGATDDSVAVQAAFDYAKARYLATSAIQTVYFPNGTYLFNRVVCEGASIIVDAREAIFHKNTSYRGLHLIGGYTNVTDIQSDASAGASTIVLPTGQGANWAAGDVGKIIEDRTTDAYGVLAALRGQFFRVVSVSTDTLTIAGTLHFDYATAQNAQVAKISSVSIRVDIGRITGESETYVTSDPHFVVVEGARGAVLKAGHLDADDGSQGAFLALMSCIGSHVELDHVEHTETTFAYPLGIYNSEDCTAKCSFAGYTRHVINMIGDDLTGTSSTYSIFSRSGWTRRCFGIDSTSFFNTQSPWDTHYGVDSCGFKNCHDYFSNLSYTIRGTNNVIVDPYARGGDNFVHVFRDGSFTATHADTNNTRVINPDVEMLTDANHKIVQHGSGGGNWEIIGGRIKVAGPTSGNFAPLEVGGGDYAEGIGKLSGGVEIIVSGTCSTYGVFYTETGATKIEIDHATIDVSAATLSSFSVAQDNASATPVTKLNRLRIRGGSKFANVSECGIKSGDEFGNIWADSLPTLVSGQTINALRPYFTGPIVDVAGGVTYHGGAQRALVEDSGTNTVIAARRASRSSTGTPAAGIGVKDEFEVETAAGNYEIGAVWEYLASDVSAGAEHFDAELKIMRAGASATRAFRARSDGTFDHVMCANGGGAALKHVTALLSAVSGATVTASNLIPAGARVVSVTTRITTQLGAGSGTTGYQVGDGSDADRWGVASAVTAGTQTGMIGAGAPTADPAAYFVAANNVVITAVGGNFDGTGAIRVVVAYWDGVAPTS